MLDIQCCDNKWLIFKLLWFCRVVENGVETVTVEENGKLTSKTVNGKAQAIDYRKV